MARASTTRTWIPNERLQEEDLAQAAAVEATFVYHASMRDQMLRRKAFPHLELEQRNAALKSAMPRAEIQENSESAD